MLIPRKVGFDREGRAVGAGFNSIVENAPVHKIMWLPSESVDFIDFDVRGKTEQEIIVEVGVLGEKS
jgi:hypothetical protein